jgi:hypothetical protein
MQVVPFPLGRLGNAIFRHLATIMFHIIYNATVVTALSSPINKNEIINMDDNGFINWMNHILNGNILTADSKYKVYVFFGYFQHDAIYLKYRTQIIDYIKAHPQDKLISDADLDSSEPDKHKVYIAGDLVKSPSKFTKQYDTVLHLRLEDFITHGKVIHPESIKSLLETAGISSCCIVVNNPRTELELFYIEYLRKYVSAVFESNDIITDFHIMKNAKTLICSCSTISWAAAFFSDTVQCVYMPNYKTKDTHMTFRKPIENTKTYEYKMCSKMELELFLGMNM